jgi:hypothetical protein
MTEKIDPYRFVGPSAEELRGKTPAEQDALIETRRSEWERVKPLEIARQDARRAHIAAGGDGVAFDKQWTEGGRDAHISDQAKARQERARRESSIF